MASERKSKPISNDLKVAIVAFIGVIVGSILTGFFSIYTITAQQKLQNDQITSNNIQIETDRLIAACNNQIELFERWDDMITRYENLVIEKDSAGLRKLSEKFDLLDWYSDLIENSYKIFLISDYDFAQATISMRDSLDTATDSIMSESNRPFKNRRIQHENMGVLFEEWLFKARLELLKRNIYLTPEHKNEEEKKLIEKKLKIYKQ